MKRLLIVVVTLLMSVLLLAACETSTPAQPETDAAVEEPAAEEPAAEEPAAEEPAAEEPAAEEPAEGEEATPAAEEEATPAAEEEAEAGEMNTVEVSLVSFEIQMPSSIPAGQTEFVVTNNGDTEHNFEIEGQGIEQAFEADLQPGETQSMMVDLQPGEYTVYCPVGDHREQGMELTLSVTE